jgi:acetyl esterase/lipase
VSTDVAEPVEEFLYADRETGPLKLRVFRPTGTVRHATAVLHIHGGAWRVGTPAMLDSRSSRLAAQGYTVIQVRYRLLGEAAWPAPISDLRSALRWVVNHAHDLGARTNAIVLWGHSAGAHIALMTAATLADETLDHPDDDRSIPLTIDAVIDCYGPVSFHPGATSLLRIGIGGLDLAAIVANQRTDGALPAIDLLEGSCTQEQADAISPLALVGPDFPPTMIVHGTGDVLIRPINSRRLADTLSRLGVISELVNFAECNHEFDAAPSYAAAVVAHIDVFLRRVLHDPTLASEIAQNSMFR